MTSFKREVKSSHCDFCEHCNPTESSALADFNKAFRQAEEIIKKAMVSLYENDILGKTLNENSETFLFVDIQNKELRHSDVVQHTYFFFDKILTMIRQGKVAVSKFLNNFYLDKIKNHPFGQGSSVAGGFIDLEIEHLLDDHTRKEVAKLYKS